MSSQLTAEQQRKIEENRRKALERRAQRLGQTAGTSQQPSAGFRGSTVHAQPPKQGVSLAPAAHITSSFASKRCGPPTFQKDFQSFSNQTLQPQQPPGAGSQINQNALKNSSKQTDQHLNGSALFGGGQPKYMVACSSSGSAVSSFYKEASKPAHVSAAHLPSPGTSLTAVPAKKPAISVRGKCVPHTENRFRVEVSYHAELISVFKSISSRNYGKILPEQQDPQSSRR